MTRRTATTITVATLAAVAMLGLTACDPGTPKPTGSKTASPSATSTPTASAPQRPMPPQADPPKDGDAAVAAANKTYVAYLDAKLPFLKDLSLGPHYLDGYVLPDSPAMKVLSDTAEKSSSAPVVSGTFGWTPNFELSYAGKLTDAATGQSLAQGAVHLYGCIDNAAVAFSDASIPKGAGPFAVVLVYVSNAHAWMIQEERPTNSSDGQAPQC